MALVQTKEYWLGREWFYKEVLWRAAQELSQETKQRLGSLAWRRHEVEYGPSAGLQDFIKAASFLEGYYRALLSFLPRDEMASLLTIYREVKREQGK